MAKKPVNSISKGRATKGKRETSVVKTKPTASGGQQFDRGTKAINSLPESRFGKPFYQSIAFYSALDRRRKDSPLYGKTEKELLQLKKAYEEADHKIKMAKLKNSEKKK